MSIFTALYNLLIGPLELFFEIIYSLAFRVTQNPGLSIIVLSLLMNFLVLPLYKQADEMQAQQRDMEKKLHFWESHIKKTFQGDERYMMIQTYYRQNHYKPTYALRGMVSLLLEIPFFIAAYNMLSSLNVLHGVSFGPIRDLGAPDALLVIGGISINVLPILMTVINGITSAIYTKGYPLKSKLQLYGMALVFLVLLYTSPSGLVFYWTLNNLFSLVKTLFYQLKNPKKVLCILSSAVGGAALVFLLWIHPMPTVRSQTILCGLLLVMQVPLITMLVGKRGTLGKAAEATKTDRVNFHLGCLFLAVLVGIVIPSGVIKASPEEFINRTTLHNPLLYVFSAAVLAFGLFLIWGEIFFRLASPKAKKWMSWGVLAISAGALIDYLFFSNNLGTLSSELQFHTVPAFPGKMQLLNLLVLAAAAGLLYWIWHKRGQIVKTVYSVSILAFLIMSVLNIVEIQSIVPGKIKDLSAAQEQEAEIPLSRNGKNVMVLMMDRAIGRYVPYMFNERPELREQFAGFTYYPNTISYGGFTNMGSPALYGGYDYTPTEMNKRDQELLVDKHNEALKLMPHLFSEAGYEVTISNPSYAGYGVVPDVSIYEDYPDIHAYTVIHRMTEEERKADLAKEGHFQRNLFCYSLFKAAPVVLQSNLYDGGYYNDLNRRYWSAEDEANEDPLIAAPPQTIQNLSQAVGVNSMFLYEYRGLRELQSLTHVSDDSQNTLFIISNETPHEPALLQTPDYEPAVVVDNTEYDAAHRDCYTIDGHTMKMETELQVTHYHANMATMIQLGKWFDYLREQGVYDNTRIIVVSDHGRYCRQFDDFILGEGTVEGDVESINALLMVKDFGSTEFTVDDRFMTNADVPTIATAGLLENPVNPFTGNAVNSDRKHDKVQRILASYKFSVLENNGTTFLPGPWLELRNENIFDKANWTVIHDPQ